MIIKLYLHTTPGDAEEEDSIKGLIREKVVPMLGCDPAPIEYCGIEEGRQLVVVLQRSGSQKNSVFAKVRNGLEILNRHWVRLYKFDILSGFLPKHEEVQTRMIVGEPEKIKEEENDGH